MSSPAVSHHLRHLKEAGLVVTRSEEKEVYYKVADTKEAALLHSMIEDLEHIACPNEKKSN
jgi:DNA-binding transcriptional ArsR family regulator